MVETKERNNENNKKIIYRVCLRQPCSEKNQSYHKAHTSGIHGADRNWHNLNDCVLACHRNICSLLIRERTHATLFESILWTTRNTHNHKPYNVCWLSSVVTVSVVPAAAIRCIVPNIFTQHQIQFHLLIRFFLYFSFLSGSLECVRVCCRIVRVKLWYLLFVSLPCQIVYATHTYCVYVGWRSEWGILLYTRCCRYCHCCKYMFGLRF